MNKGKIAAVAAGMLIFLTSFTWMEPLGNKQQQTNPVHRQENASVITESAVKGNPSVTARPITTEAAEQYRYSSGSCIYLKDATGNSVNQYSLNGNLLKRYEITGSEERVEVCWADRSCLIYQVDSTQRKSTLWYVPITLEEEKENLCLEEKIKIRANIDGVSNIICRQGDELVYVADERIYKKNLKTGKEISLKKGFQYEDDLEIDLDFNLNPVYKDGRVLFTTSDAKYLLDVETWKTEKVWEQKSGSLNSVADRMSTWNENRIYFQVAGKQVDVYRYELSTKKIEQYISGGFVRKKIEKMNLFSGQQVHLKDVKISRSFVYGGRFYMDIVFMCAGKGNKEIIANQLFSSSLKDSADFRYEPEVSQFMLEYTGFDEEDRTGGFCSFTEGYLSIFPYKDAPRNNLLGETAFVCYDMEAKEFSCLPDRKILYSACAAGLPVLDG